MKLVPQFKRDQNIILIPPLDCMLNFSGENALRSRESGGYDVTFELY